MALTQAYSWLIAGQGLAGSVLALELARRGQRVFVVEAGLPGAASRVAVGAYNPVTGKRMQLTWQADLLWPALEAFYPAAETLLRHRFFYSLPNLRPLFTEAERAEAEKLTMHNILAGWLHLTDELPWEPAAQVRAPFGAVLVPRAGYVDVPAFCAAVRSWLRVQDAFEEVRIEASAVEADGGDVRWRGRLYAGLIWADGFMGAQNPALSGLPLAPLKGELLRVRPTLPPVRAGAVLNRAAYLAPRSDGTLWAGSTYEHQFTRPDPTEAGRASILERVGRFYLPRLEVLEHVAGIRPSSQDRRPIAGALSLPGQYVFTGLGTKGVSIAPWLAGVLAGFLLQGIPMPAEVDVRQHTQSDTAGKSPLSDFKSDQDNIVSLLGGPAP